MWCNNWFTAISSSWDKSRNHNSSDTGAVTNAGGAASVNATVYPAALFTGGAKG